MREVVGRHCDTHSVTRENPDVVTTHAARQLGSNERTALIHLDGVLPTTQGILDEALHLQQIAFAHACVCVLSLAEVRRKLAHHFKYRNKRPIFTESKEISRVFGYRPGEPPLLGKPPFPEFSSG